MISRRTSYIGKVAIITGGGSGIGKEIARSMAKLGTKTIVFDINFKNARDVANSIKKQYHVETLSQSLS